ncbi:MAG: metal ABC transporter permease, partial [Gemmatimonadetes bacterium]
MGTEGPTLSIFFESIELFREALLAGTVAGVLLGFLGVYVVLGRMVFLSAALSNSAGLGVTLAFYAHLHWGFDGNWASPTLGATLLTLGAALFLMTDTSGQSTRRESLLGLAYLIGAAGALAVGTRIVQEVQDVHTILFGEAVAVLPEDAHLLTGVAVVVLIIHLWWLRGFLQA